MAHHAEVTPWRWLLIIFTIALVGRVAAVLLLGVPDIVGYSESGLIAKNLVEGRGFTFDLFGTRTEKPLQSFLPPLFPWLIAFCLHYFAQPHLALGFIQSVLSSLTAVLLYFIAGRLSGDNVIALLTAVGMALYPVFVLMSALPPSLTLSLFLLALFLWLTTVEPAKLGYGAAAGAGIVLGLSALVRPMAIGFLFVVLVWWVLQWSSMLMQIAKLTTVLAFFALLTILPWTVRNYLVHGRFVLISANGGYNFWAGNNPFTTGSGLEVENKRLAQFLNTPVDPNSPPVVEMLQYPFPADVQAELAAIDEVALEKRLYQAGLQFIRQQPLRWAELALAKLQGFWWFRQNIGANYQAAWTSYYKLLYIVLLCLALPGLLLSFRQWRRYALLYGLFGYYTLVYIIFHVQTRYRWEIEPFLLIFAALSLAAALRILVQSRDMSFAMPR